MTESELLELGKRLERVERSVRRYRAALGIAGLLLAVGLLSTSGFFATGRARPSSAPSLSASDFEPVETIPAQIVARSFVLVDANGRTRAKLFFDTWGARLDFFNEAGKPRMTLDTVGDAPFLQLFDKAGKTRVGLYVVGDGPALRLYDKAGKERVALDAVDDAPGLVLYDKAGELRAALGIAGDAPDLGLYDKAETPRVGLSVGDDGPALRLYDKAGKERAALGTTELKNTATGSTETRAESSLVLFNQRGRVLWEAP